MIFFYYYFVFYRDIVVHVLLYFIFVLFFLFTLSFSLFICQYTYSILNKSWFYILSIYFWFNSMSTCIDYVRERILFCLLFPVYMHSKKKYIDWDFNRMFFAVSFFVRYFQQILVFFLFDFSILRVLSGFFFFYLFLPHLIFICE